MSTISIPQDIFLTILEKLRNKRDYYQMCEIYKELYGEDIPEMYQRIIIPYKFNYFNVHVDRCYYFQSPDNPNDSDASNPATFVDQSGLVCITYDADFSYLTLEEEHSDYDINSVYDALYDVDDVKMIRTTFPHQDLVNIINRKNYKIHSLGVNEKDFTNYLTNCDTISDELSNLYISIDSNMEILYNIFDYINNMHKTPINIVIECKQYFNHPDSEELERRELNIKKFSDNINHLKTENTLSLHLEILINEYCGGRYKRAINDYIRKCQKYLTYLTLWFIETSPHGEDYDFIDFPNLSELVININLSFKKDAFTPNIYISSCESLEYIAIIIDAIPDVYEKKINIYLSNMPNSPIIHTNEPDLVNIDKNYGI